MVAVVLALGLLHGPSMMLPSAASAGDCHAMAALSPHSHVMDHDHGSPAGAHTMPVSDNGQTAASACPLANIAGVTAFSPDFTPVQRAVRLSVREPIPLISAILDRPDPPPRHAA